MDLIEQLRNYLEGVEWNGPADAFYEHAVKARSQYDEQYRAMATEILAARHAIRHAADALTGQEGAAPSPRADSAGLLHDRIGPSSGPLLASKPVAFSPRCEARMPDIPGAIVGARCGLPKGHDGSHTVLIPSSAPWFREPLEGTEPTGEGERTKS